MPEDTDMDICLPLSYTVNAAMDHHVVIGAFILFEQFELTLNTNRELAGLCSALQPSTPARPTTCYLPSFKHLALHQQVERPAI